MEAFGALPRYRVALVRETENHWDPVRIITPHDVVDLLKPMFSELDREAFVVVALDVKHRVIGVNIVSIGDLSGTLAHPREVYKPAILLNAGAIIVAHNHPSGDPEPSREDKELTARLGAAGKLLGIPLLDSIIIAENGYVSLRERGYYEPVA